MSALRFNKIIFIESHNDLRTGMRLAEDLPYIGISNDLEIPIEYYDVFDKSEFFSRLNQLTVEAQEGTLFPILQIDAHGHQDPDGFLLRSGELINWQELEEPLRALNIAARCNLLLVTATCFGAVANSTIGIANRAPFWAAVGPAGEIAQGDILDSLRRFYSALLAQESPQSILNSLEASELRFVTAEWFFIRYYRYLVNELNPNIPASQVEFENFLNHFFMTDLYPENADKFTVTFEGAGL